MVVGIIIGASIFVQPSEVSRHVSTIPAMFGVWAAAGLLSICGALVSARLATAFPHTGGIYVYLKETMSPALGFLWGWAMFWSAHSGIIAAISMVLARYAAVLVPMDDREMKLVAIGCILLLSAVNYVGVRAGSTVQTTFTIAKIAAIAAILIAVATLVPPAAHSENVVSGPQGFSEFLLAISAGLFAYGGWHQVTYAAGETIEPKKTIPRALMVGMAIVTTCYLALNAAYLHVLPLKTVLNSQHIAADAASVLMGPRAAALVAGLVIVSAFGGLSGTVLQGPGRPRISGHGHCAQAISDSARRDYRASYLGQRSGRDRHLSSPVHPRGLYRVSVFRIDGDRPDASRKTLVSCRRRLHRRMRHRSRKSACGGLEGIRYRIIDGSRRAAGFSLS
jgi:APA family basic amino acid/polyamine antiporter